MNQRNLSHQELKNITGFSSATIAKIGKDESITLETIDKLCAALKVPIDKIVKVTDENGNDYSNDPIDEHHVMRELEGLKDEFETLKMENRKMVNEKHQLEKLLMVQTGISDTDLPNSTFAERVKMKRQEHGLSVIELAEKVDVNPLTIYKFEDGSSENPQMKALIGLSAALKCSIEWLVFGVKSK
jgi:DNA (cytosine-5)-methyltransferase 1